MAGYNTRFETFDSLDYLIPPVKKAHRPFQTDLLLDQDFQKRTDVRLIKDFRKKITTRIRPQSASHVPTSSVILKKTREEVTHEQYSLINSNNKNNSNTTKCLPVYEERQNKYTIEDKPIIKVKVIPRQNSQTKVFNKRRGKAKQLQSTVSNQENSIKSQSIYFMVKGKRREKVYEIKSSESTNLSKKFINAKYEDISIQQISSSKRLINSLNMEKKKRKNKKIESSNPNINHFGGICENIKNYEETKGVNARKSKVTIVGQLGLTRDDQYILKCAATVDDKPIDTNYTYLDSTLNTNKNLLNVNSNAEAFTSKFQTIGFPIDSDDYRKFRQQDSNIQTDMCCANMYFNPVSFIKEHEMTSQATQVNFNQPKQDSFKCFKNKTAQCNCNISTAENNVIKKDQSPLVIISVYPRHDKEDNNVHPIKIIQQTASSLKKVNNISKGRKRQKQNDFILSGNHSEQKSPRSRSPSPAAKSIPNKTLVDNTACQILGKNNKNMNNQKSQLRRNVDNPRYKLNNLNKDANCYCLYSGLGNMDYSKFEVKPRASDIKETDTKQVKQALVNHFLKRVDRLDLSDAKNKHLTPKNDTSRVKINIDSEKARYDLLFAQNDFDTGLSVRKSMKKPSLTFSAEDEAHLNSIENFLMLSDEIKNNIPMYSQGTSDFSNVEPIKSRLNVRDSLEICHRREDRAGSRLNHQIRNKDDVTDSFIKPDITAPVKHYRGDNCSLPDPNERDKEIRSLLGIVQNTRNPKRNEVVATEDLKVFYSHPENQKRKKDSSCCIKRNSKSLMIIGKSIFKPTTKNIKRKKDSNQCISKASTQSIKFDDENIEQKGTQASQQMKNLYKKTEKSSPGTLVEKLSAKEIHEERPVTYQQENENFTKETDVKHNFIFNRNVKVFLQIQNYTTEKPIILTRNQYEKVKKTIQCTMRQHNSNNLNKVSIGEIKIKPILLKSQYEREVQTERSEIKKTIKSKLIQTQHIYNKPERTKTYDAIQNSGQKNVDKRISIGDINIDKNINKDVAQKYVKPKGIMNCSTDTNNDKYKNIDVVAKQVKRNDKMIFPTDTKHKDKSINKDITEKHVVPNSKMISTSDSYNNKNIKKVIIDNPVKPNRIPPRQTSSMENCFKVAFVNHIPFLPAHFGDGLHNIKDTKDTLKPSTSLHTIFKGHRKFATPNLGTSANSLCSGTNDSIKSVKVPACYGDPKPKKPFLQRLLSCLVMRSTTTVLKGPQPTTLKGPKRITSVNSSVDSYHISTSLGAFQEMSSSLYDTSASFYSTHNIEQTNKMKRGFFSSVRGFLATRI